MSTVEAWSRVRSLWIAALVAAPGVAGAQGIAGRAGRSGGAWAWALWIVALAFVAALVIGFIVWGTTRTRRGGGAPPA